MSTPEDTYASGHGPDVCGVCPICSAARALGATRPEVLEHLAEAAQHLAAALRLAVDGAATSSRPREDPPTAAAPGATAEAADDGGVAGDADERDAGADAGSTHGRGQEPTIRARQPGARADTARSGRVRRIDLD